MTQKHHIMHGRDHAPGGADPIPGAAGGGVVTYSISGTLTTRTGGLRWYALSAGSITQLWVSVGTAPLGGPVGIRIKQNGVSAATISILSGTNTTHYATTLPFVAGDYFTVDITSIGPTTAGSDLVVELAMSGGV